jgi:hypothetical protein
VFNRKRNGKDELSFGIIHAVQLISKYNEDSSSEGAAVGYYSFELNLVLENGSRVNVVSHGDKERMVSDAEEVTKFLGKPLWNAL